MLIRPTRCPPSLPHGLFTLPLILLLLNGCDNSNTTSAPTTATPAATITSQDQSLQQTTLQIWEHGGTVVQECHQQARTLQQTLNTLLQKPDDTNLQHAHRTWHQAHNCLQTLRPYLLFADVSPDLFTKLGELSFAIDASPIQPGYLDYFDVYSFSGIVHDIAVPLTAADLRQQHGFSDVTDVSVGFHAIAYLLWGEHGTRPLTDFIAETSVTAEQQSGGLSLADLPGHRRRALLTLLSQLLVDDIQLLQQQFSTSAVAAETTTQTTMATSAMAATGASLPPVTQLSSYQQLPANSRLLLWQQVIQRQLAQMIAASSADAPPHNEFAGNNQQVLIAELNGLEQVLFDGDGQQPLVSFMLATEGQAELRKALADAKAELVTVKEPQPTADATQEETQQGPKQATPEPAEETEEEQQERLQRLLQALTAAAATLAPASQQP